MFATFDQLDECPHCYSRDIGGIVGTDTAICFDCGHEWNALRPLFDKRDEIEHYLPNPRKGPQAPRSLWISELFADTRRKPEDFYEELVALHPLLEESAYLGRGRFVMDPDALWPLVSDWDQVEEEFAGGWSVVSPTKTASRAIMVSGRYDEPAAVYLSIVDMGRPVVFSYGGGLDSFGLRCGATAPHVQALDVMGYDIVGYDIGDDDVGLVDKGALRRRKYNVVLASNVINVQPSWAALNTVLDELRLAAGHRGMVVMNLADDPRWLFDPGAAGDAQLRRRLERRWLEIGFDRPGSGTKVWWCRGRA